MAAVQLKPSAVADFFPDERSEALNDSFYSQQSNSNYSTYSQDVKYIFNPKVATRGPSSQGNYSEIDNYSGNSQRNISRSVHSDASKTSPESRASSASCRYNGHMQNPMTPASKTKSTESIANAQYGLSVKSVGYPQRYTSMENVNSPMQHNFNGDSRQYQRQFHASSDALMSPPKTNYNNNHKSFSNNNTPNHAGSQPNQNTPKTRQMPRGQSADASPKTHTPRIVDANHNLKVPPKPKRLHQMNFTPDKPKDKQPQSQEIYATPVQNKAFKKQKRNIPLPPPPPYCAPKNLNPALYDKDDFASRRRTWSPPTFSRMVGSVGSVQLQAMRCYRSNEQLDVDDENPYEDLDTLSNASAPPKMADSGQLTKTPHERIIKPIAFKPIITPQNRFTPQRPAQKSSSPLATRLSPPSQVNQISPATSYQNQMSPHNSHLDRPDPSIRLANHSHDDGYMSQEGNHSNSGMSHHGNHMGIVQVLDSTLDRSIISHSSSLEGHCQSNGYHYKNSCDGHSYASSNLSRVSGEVYNVSTPSPSDSGVGEMEALLRSKDAEIRQLRETMEKNESAILQVYEEKRQNWNVEVRDHITEMERRLRTQQQKSFKTEQGLLMQLFKLQQDRKALRLESDTLRSEKETLEKKFTEISEELKHANNKREECNWELQQKLGEISLLKSQLKEAKEDVTAKSTELIGTRTQVKEMTLQRDSNSDELRNMAAELEQSRQDFKRLQQKLDVSQTELDEAKQIMNTRKNSTHIETGVITDELANTRKELADAKLSFAQEKEQWLDEKNKVIRYQKHLQLNYVQVMRKNKLLEDEVEQLTLELENRDIKLMHENNPIVEEESIC